MSEKKYKSLRRVVRELWTLNRARIKWTYRQFYKQAKRDFKSGKLKIVRGQ